MVSPELPESLRGDSGQPRLIRKNRCRARRKAKTSIAVRPDTMETGSGTIDTGMIVTVPGVLVNGTAESSLKLLSTMLKYVPDPGLEIHFQKRERRSR
jgi:hypothetical protein